MSEEEARAVDVHVERMRDRVRHLIALRFLERYVASINWDALNDYYGFHGRSTCNDSCLSVTHTPSHTI